MLGSPVMLACSPVVWLVVGGAAAPAGPTTQTVMVDISATYNGSWGAYPRHEGHPHLRRPFSLDSGAEGYSLAYNCCTHKSHAPEVATPEGYIGMPRPSSANWYSNGFLRFIVNGRDIGRTPLAALRKAATGRQGSVQLVWSRDDVSVRATFLMCVGDPTLYLEVAVAPKGAVKSLETVLTAYPIAYVTNGDRWVVTPKRGIRQAHTEAIDPTQESWLLVQDHKLSGPGRGGCGLAMLPGEVAKGVAKVGTYGVLIELTSRPGVPRMRLAIWDFHRKADAEARAYVESAIARVRERLTTLDFTNPRLQPTYWAGRRPELVGLLARVKDRPKLTSRVRTCVDTIDRLHARMAQHHAKSTPLPTADEQALLDALGQIRSAYWDLRLAALFADD